MGAASPVVKNDSGSSSFLILSVTLNRMEKSDAFSPRSDSFTRTCTVLAAYTDISLRYLFPRAVFIAAHARPIAFYRAVDRVSVAHERFSCFARLYKDIHPTRIAALISGNILIQSAHENKRI